MLLAVFSQEREQKELDIEFNTLGSISSLARQEAIASHFGGIKTPPSLSPPIPDWRWEQGKVGICTVEVKMVQGEKLDHKGLSVQPGERRDWWGGGPTQSMTKLGKSIGHFKAGPSPSLIQVNIIPGKQKVSLNCDLHLHSALASSLHGHVALASTHPMAFQRETLSLSCPPGNVLAPFMWSFWPWSMQSCGPSSPVASGRVTPHTGSRQKKLEMDDTGNTH